MKKNQKIIIDTNILVSAIKSKRGASYKILSLINSDKFEFYISVPLILEYEDVLKRPELGLNLSHREIDKLIDILCLLGKKNPIWFSWRPVSKDAKDDFVAELAINAQVDAIITYNIKDFHGLEKFGVKILTPSEFLIEIGEN